MKPTSHSCDRELLRRSLDDSLSEQQEEDLSHHLSTCSACQSELERLAGEQRHWSQVGRILRQEAQSSRTGIDEEHRNAAHDSHVDSFADFAVDFLAPTDDPVSIGRLGDNDILQVIGRGGMGVVLKGFQSELNRHVAVKVLAPHLATSGAARQRFAREAQAAAAIVHPNVMPILTVDSSGRLPFLVMPCVACESLQQRIDRQGSLPVADVLRIGVQAARGLAAAHAQGLVHRDVKPANILLEKGVERVMLTDFGLARAVDDATLTKSGVIAGTPQYMSPEQARGEAVDARSDLFSLGSVLYAMCAGRPPFRAESAYGILRRITDTDPRPIQQINPEVPAWLAAVIDKLLAKEAADRFESAEQLADLLEQCLAHVQQPTTVPLPKCLPKGKLPSAAFRAAVAKAKPFIGVAIIGALMSGALLTRQMSRPLRDKEISPPDAAVTVEPNALASPAPDENALLEWELVEQPVRRLKARTQQLQADMDQLWHPPPMPTTGGDNPFLSSSDSQEFQP